LEIIEMVSKFSSNNIKTNIELNVPNQLDVYRVNPRFMEGLK